MADHRNPRIAGYFDRLDAQLANEADHGYRAALLAGQIDAWESRFQRLQEWAANPQGRPNPLGEGATVWDVESTLSGLYARQQAMGAEARLRVAIATADMGAR